MTEVNREWDTEDDRERITKELNETDEIGDVYRLMSLIESAFCDPFQVTEKPIKVGEAEQADDNDDENATKG